jgi:hypothetical protein
MPYRQAVETRALRDNVHLSTENLFYQLVKTLAI